MPNMEVALTCRARPVLNHSHIDLSGTGGGTARKNKVSGVRCQMRGVRVAVATRRSPQADWGRCGARKYYVPSRNVDENKENKVSGVRCKVSGCSSWLGSPGRRVRDLRREKTTFQAGMYMKTKRTRCQVSGARCQGAHLGWEVPAGALETCGAKELRSKPECV